MSADNKGQATNHTAAALLDGFDEFWADRHIKQILNPAGFARFVWAASARYNRKTVLGAMDSTTGFYPADEGSNPSGQAINAKATNPSPEPVARVTEFASAVRMEVECLPHRGSLMKIGDMLYAGPAQAPAVGPLTQQAVVDAFCKLPHPVQFVSAFDAGVRFAERHYGIASDVSLESIECPPCPEWVDRKLAITDPAQIEATFERDQELEDSPDHAGARPAIS